MYPDEDLIPISALQHHLFCARQCALIHIDGLWAENHLTAHGRVLHERSDTPGSEHRRIPSTGATSRASESDKARSSSGSRRIVRSMPLRSSLLGLVGKADQVEITGVDGSEPQIRPVEHKRGKPKRLDHDRVQLAAQAMCLEEMFDVAVNEGDIFYHAVRRKETVPITDGLRSTVKRVTKEIRYNIKMNVTPRVERKSKCVNCSLLNLCIPRGTAPSRDPGRYLARSLRTALEASPAPPSERPAKHSDQ